MPGCAFEDFFSSAQLNRWADAIDRRFSCRQFSGPADMTQQGALHYFAGRSQLPGVRIDFFPCDSQALFLPVPIVGRIEYATQCASVFYDTNEPQGRLHAGIAGEALQLEMVSLGLQGCWVSGTYRRRAVSFKPAEHERIAGLLPYGLPHAPDGASQRRRKPLAKLCLDDPARWPLWAYQVAEAVRAAPSALNAQPWRFSFSGSTLRLSGRGFPDLNHGIAVLHALCALRALPHSWRYSSDGRALLITPKENDDTI